MKNNNLLITIVLVILAILITLNLFKTSANLKESKKIIENLMVEVESSKAIIEKQAVTIDELYQLNKELLTRVTRVDSVNDQIKRSIDIKLGKTNKSISEIKQTIEDIKPLKID